MQDQMSTERGVFGMPKPHGWPIERIVSLVAGAVVLATQIAQAVRPAQSGRLRFLAGWVGANLLFNAAVGWCPLSALLHRAGILTAAEREAHYYTK